MDKEKYLVFLFDSGASGKYSHSSDIDIGVFGEKPREPRLLNKIKAEIEESIIPYGIEIFELIHEKLQKHAKNNL